MAPLISCGHLSPDRQTLDGHLKKFFKMVKSIVVAVMVSVTAVSAILLGLVPVIVHIRAKSFAISVLIVALMLLNIRHFLNAILWHKLENTEWDGQIFCDVDIRVTLGSLAAINGAVASVFRHLAIAVRADRVSMEPSWAGIIKAWLFDTTFCAVIPLILMALQHLATSSRYVIIPVTGCAQLLNYDLKMFCFQIGWIMVVTILAAIYCSLTIIRLLRHRREVSSMLESSNIGRNRYIRLYIIAALGLAFLLPLTVVFPLQFITRSGSQFLTFASPEHQDNATIKLVFSAQNAAVAQTFLTIGLSYITLLLLSMDKEGRDLYRNFGRRLRMLGRGRSRKTARAPCHEGASSQICGANVSEIGVNDVPRRMDDIELQLWLVDNEHQPRRGQPAGG